MSGAFGQPIKQATIDEYFLTSPGEELVDNTILQMSKIKNNTSNPFVQLFGPYTKGSDQQRWANYDRRDWSIRQFPVINVYEAESQDKTSSNAWVNGTVAMLVCWPSSQRRSDLSRVQMAFQGALLDFFESQEATDMLDELYFIKRDAKVNGLNEYGKIITWTPNVEGIIENEEVPIINNMPDAAFGATERQFVGLLDAGSGCETVVVTRHTMAGVPRGERIRARIAAEYRPLEDIISDPPDLLVVTGSNPIESRIEDEPYWSDLCGLLRWASENVPAMVLSCLSAHAALAVFDGVERTTLPAKCTGVFAQEADPTHPLAAGMPEMGTVVLPHSRLNTVPLQAVAAAGYAVALQSEEVGWSVVTKTVGECEVVLVQAHPEYDPSSLVREYDRDVRRYAGHERDELPCLPRDCVAGPDRDGLRRLHERVVGGERDPALVGRLPLRRGRYPRPLAVARRGQRLYANLVGTITKRSA